MYNNYKKYGKNTMQPAMAAQMAQISTAPAATSFTSPAIGWKSGDTRLTSLSIAVLKPSAASTIPKQMITMHHSVEVMLE